SSCHLAHRRPLPRTNGSSIVAGSTRHRLQHDFWNSPQHLPTAYSSYLIHYQLTVPRVHMTTEKPKRRPRYAGKHPRHFSEKYKEHRPDRYAEDVAKVIGGGKTPAGTHRPIMVREILETLNAQPGQLAVDCTLGYGGHARSLLSAIQPGGRFIG